MEHRAHVREGKKIQNVILAGFDISFDFGKAGNERERVAVVRVFVLRNGEQSLAGQRSGGYDRKFVDVRRQVVTVVNAAELNGALRGLRQRHSTASAFV